MQFKWRLCVGLLLIECPEIWHVREWLCFISDNLNLFYEINSVCMQHNTPFQAFQVIASIIAQVRENYCTLGLYSDWTETVCFIVIFFFNFALE
jgi:hypothetical protein